MSIANRVSMVNTKRGLADLAAGTLLGAMLLMFAGVALGQQTGVEIERPTARHGDLVSVFSGDIHIPSHVRQHGTVVCIGGDVVVEGDVTQDVVVILGSLKLSGKVGGQVVGVLSESTLTNARVSDQLVNVLGSLELEGTTLEREMINVLGSLDRDDMTRIRDQVVNIGFGSWAPSVWALLLWVRLFHKFIVFVLIVALISLIPERVRAMSDEAPVGYVPAFFLGLAGYLGMLILVPLLSLTVVGVFPVVLAFYVVKWAGIAAIFHAVGRRLGRVSGTSLSLLGATLLVFGVYVVAFTLPSFLGLAGLLILGVLKLLFFLLIEVPAVGLVIRTRMGRPATAPTLPPPADQPAPPESDRHPADPDDRIRTSE